LVVGNDGVTKCERMGRHEQVSGTDWSASLLEPRAQQSLGGISRCFEGQNFKRPKHRFKLG
jgi:hypothetical protein